MRQFLAPTAPIADAAPASPGADPVDAFVENIIDAIDDADYVEIREVAEDHDGVEVIRMADTRTTHEPNPIIADFVDPPHGANATTDEDSIMHRILKKVMCTLRDEISSKGTNEPRWLSQYLKDHNFWIPQCGVYAVAKKLKIEHMTEEDKYYMRGIRIWFPEFEVGKTCVPCCPNCGDSGQVEIHSYFHFRLSLLYYDTAI